jgi:hypothetical protein
MNQQRAVGMPTMFITDALTWVESQIASGTREDRALRMLPSLELAVRSRRGQSLSGRNA